MHASMVALMTIDVLPPGTTVNDRYVLGPKLGSDGQVYQAFDQHVDRTVAMKILNPIDGKPQSWDEAKRLEQLRSAFIVPVLNADVIRDIDIRFITTEVLPDGDLEAESRPHGLSLALAVRFGNQIAAGVDTIHSAGMIHRDVKPANALRRGDIVLVSDVAMCIVLNEEGRAPRDGSWCTLAPEAAVDSGHCSVRTDVYSLAATVFFLLSAEYPVDHRLPRQQQQGLIAAGKLRDISLVAPHVPRSIATVVRRGLSLDPNRRYPSAIAFGNALTTALGRRLDWVRKAHDGHLYCAESSAQGTGKAMTVCSRKTSEGSISIRAYHSKSGRAVSGVAERLASPSQHSNAMRRFFAELS